MNTAEEGRLVTLAKQSSAASAVAAFLLGAIIPHLSNEWSVALFVAGLLAALALSVQFAKWHVRNRGEP